MPTSRGDECGLCQPSLNSKGTSSAKRCGSNSAAHKRFLKRGGNWVFPAGLVQKCTQALVVGAHVGSPVDRCDRMFGINLLGGTMQARQLSRAEAWWSDRKPAPSADPPL